MVQLFCLDSQKAEWDTPWKAWSHCAVQVNKKTSRKMRGEFEQVPPPRERKTHSRYSSLDLGHHFTPDQIHFSLGYQVSPRTKHNYTQLGQCDNGCYKAQDGHTLKLKMLIPAEDISPVCTETWTQWCPPWPLLMNKQQTAMCLLSRQRIVTQYKNGSWHHTTTYGVVHNLGQIHIPYSLK